ncbi:hypothetical protein ACQEVB_40875 [Pseudonocardia sp. CA-107938]|uniref:hypothetical protein n=1 Tax=Pseudonocardia sp. CA-107938 TaxID=3240021 RepID=UPI003D93A499
MIEEAATAAAGLRHEVEQAGLCPEIRTPDPERLGDRDAYTAVTASLVARLANERRISAIAGLFVDHLRDAARTHPDIEHDL